MTRCVAILDFPEVMPGWGCCNCRFYNGIQRPFCKNCGHIRCVTLPKPSELGLCEDCGVPVGEEARKYKQYDGRPVEHTPDCSRRIN